MLGSSLQDLDRTKCFVTFASCRKEKLICISKAWTFWLPQQSYMNLPLSARRCSPSWWRTRTASSEPACVCSAHPPLTQQHSQWSVHWMNSNECAWGLPFSACSMICLRAFFRLLALSISCSLERYVFPSVPDSPPQSLALEPPPSWLGTDPAGTTWKKIKLCFNPFVL